MEEIGDTIGSHMYLNQQKTLVGMPLCYAVGLLVNAKELHIQSAKVGFFSCPFGINWFIAVALLMPPNLLPGWTVETLTAVILVFENEVIVKGD